MLSDADIQRYAVEWGMPVPDGLPLAREYAEVVRRDTYFATAMKVPFCMFGQKGIMMLLSTGASSNQAKLNYQEYEQRLPILTPHWMLYEVYWFPTLVLGNFKGITEARYSPTLLPGTFGEFLGQYFASKGVSPTDWRRRYCQPREGYFRTSLRILLQQEFSVRYWMEIVAGRSWLAFRGLDVYVSYHSAMSAPEQYAAWYLVNVEADPMHRYDRGPEDWYRCSVFVCVGQRETIDEWVLMSQSLVPTARL